MNELTLDQVQEFYNFLTGEELIKEVDVESPKLTNRQAFDIIYILQEHYNIIPQQYELCDECENIYDSSNEGHNYDCTDCDHDGCCYLDMCMSGEINNDNIKLKEFIDGKNFCCQTCEYDFIVSGGF
jgi:hypothetical protein